MKKPSLIFGLLIAAVFFVGFFMMAGNNDNGYYVLYGALGLGVIYWIWSIIQVSGTNDLKKYQKTFWLILVVAVPFFGALLYNIIHQTTNKIAA